MSPESNSTTENRIVSGQTVRVPKPDAGAEIAITSSPGGVLDLPFDPGTATTTRVDNSLVFELDGGGKVTVTDFFAVGDESLPNLRLPDGVEVASVDFFEGSGLDMTTAAGPGAGTPPGSGTSYDDDGGNLLAGVDKYGMLGTDYWGRDTEPDIEARGLYVGGDFDFGAITPGTPGAGGGGIGIFGGFVYEDARPLQNLYGVADDQGPLQAGRLVAEFRPNAGSYTDSVELSNFPEGTQVWLGDPANGGQLLTPDANGMYTFDAERFDVNDPIGVYIIPPQNTDDDFTVNATVIFGGGGAPVRVDGTFEVRVDAAADLAEDFKPELVVTDLQPGTEENEISKDKDTGDFKSGEASNIDLKLEAHFGDFADGSERKFFDVENVPTDWILQEGSIPAGWKLMLKGGPDANGNPVYTEITYDQYLAMIAEMGNGYYSISFEVTAEAQANGGNVNQTISFNPQDWTTGGVEYTGERDENGNLKVDENGDYLRYPDGEGPGRWSDGSLNTDGPAKLGVNAVAQETATDDDDYSNNTSIVKESTVEVSLVEDTPDFKVTEGGKTVENQHVDHLLDDGTQIIANVGLGESPEVSGSHGGGEFTYDKLDQVTGNSDLSTLLKNLVAGTGTPNQDQPLGMNHAYAGNASNTSQTENGRDYIRYDLHSDGADDQGSFVNPPTIGWDAENLLRAVTEGDDKRGWDGDNKLYSKLTGELAVEGTYTYIDSNGNEQTVDQKVNGQGYAELHFEVTTIDGQSVMFGFFFDSNGNKVVALVGVISPNGDGTADVTFAQYTPLWHPSGGTANADNMQSYFQVVLTDDDGDKTYGVVQYRSLDDVAEAGGKVVVTFDEAASEQKDFTDSISGNVLDKKVTGQDGQKVDGTDENGTKAAAADSGSDGWAADAATGTPGGVVGYTITGLPNGYFVGDANGDPVSPLKVGESYTIYTAKGTAQGTFSLDAQGNWTFAQGDGNVIKDYDFEVKYTVQDADGDTATGSLVIKSEAAPLLVTLTGSSLVAESALPAGEHGHTDHDHGAARYTVSLKDWNSLGDAKGEAVDEDVTARIKISLQDKGASYEDFDFATDPKTGDPCVVYTYQYYDEFNQLQTETVYAPITTDGPPVTEITFEVTVPAGSEGNVQFELPINDDNVGGKGQDANDGMQEEYTVAVDEVLTGNAVKPSDVDDSKFPEQAKQPDTAETVILDDGTVWNPAANNGEGAWEYESNELGAYVGSGDGVHTLDGPVVGLELKAGPNGKFDSKGNTLTEDTATGGESNMYLNVTLDTFTGTGAGGQWGGPVTENITVTLKFTNVNVDNANTAAPNDGVRFTLAQSMIQMIKDGKIILDPPNEALNANPNSSSALQVDGNGNFSFQITDKFDPTSSDMNNLRFVARTSSDNVVETNEQTFTAEVVGATGQECLYDGTKETVTVTDNLSGGYLTLTGGGTVPEGTDLTFNLKLVDANNNALANSKIQGPVDVKISFTPTEQDWVEGGLKADGATAGADYLALVNAALNATPEEWAAARDALALALGFKPGEVTINSITPKGDGGFELDLSITADGMKNGGLNITVPTIKDTIAGEADEMFTVKLEGYGNDGKGTLDAGDQEIQGIKNDKATGVIEDATLTLSISGDKHVYEEQAYGETKHPGVVDHPDYTVAHYAVAWGYENNAVFENADTFSFTITLGNIGAKFSDNPGSAALDGTEDYGWAVKNPVTGEYEFPADHDALVNAINAEFAALYGDPHPTVTVSSDGTTLTVNVPKGCDLSNGPLPIHVGAIDDYKSDNGEQYKVTIGGVVADPDRIDVAIDGQNSETTTIHDAANTGDNTGFRIGLEDCIVNESERYASITVVLYDENGNAFTDQSKPPLDVMTITLSYGSGAGAHDATPNSDFHAKGSQTFEVAEWKWVEDPVTGTGTWQAVLKIELIDDRISEFSEDFSVTITGVKGGEASPYDDSVKGALGSGKHSANGTVLDDTHQDWTPKLDGPLLVHFAPDEPLREPVASGSSQDASISKEVGYTLVFDQKAHETQDVFVWLSLDANGAVLGQDYSLNIVDISSFTKDNVLDMIKQGGLFSANDANAIKALLAQAGHDFNYDFSVPEGAQYFVIVPAGSAKGSFTVNILHDHDTGNERGVDGAGEGLTWKVEGMSGSEAQYDPKTPEYSAPIVDDMEGPTVAIKPITGGTQTPGHETTITVTFADNDTVVATENTYVVITIVKSDGSVEYHEVMIPAGENSVNYTYAVPGTDFYQIVVGKMNPDGTFAPSHKFLNVDENGVPLDVNGQQITDGDTSRYTYTERGTVDGGESQRSTDVQTVDVGGTGGSGGRVTLGVSASENIHEVMDPANPADPNYGKADSVTYTVRGDVPDGYAGGDVSFTLRAVDGSTSAGDLSSREVKVTLSKEMLEYIKNNGGEFELTLDPDGHHTLKVGSNYVSSIPDGWLQVDGTVTAADDNRIEPTESFTTIITGVSGNATVDVNNATASTNVIDNDTPKIVVEVLSEVDNGSGVMVSGGTEGGDPVEVRVSLQGPGGSEVLLGDAPMTFELTFTSGNAVDGSDFVSYTTKVTIQPGQSFADVKIALPENFVENGDRSFNVTATLVQDDYYDAKYGDMKWAGQQNPGDPVSGTSEDIHIIEHPNGPEVRLDSLGGKINEGQDATFAAVMDKVLEEDGTITVNVALENFPDGATVDSHLTHFTLLDGLGSDVLGTADLTGVTLAPNGKYTLDLMSTGNPSVKVGEIVIKVSADGKSMEVTMPAADGTGRVPFAIGTADDSETMSNGKITAEITGVSKGEMSIDSGNASASVNVDDVLQGPTVSLNTGGEYASAEEGTEAFLGLDLAFKPGITSAVADFTVNLTVADTSVLSSNVVTVYSKQNGVWVAVGTATIGSGGKLSVTVPEGATDIKLGFQTMDNAVVGDNNPPLEVVLNGVAGGEASAAGAGSVSSSFAQETYNSMTYDLKGGTEPLTSQNTVTYKLTGVDPDNVGKVFIDGTDVTSQVYIKDGVACINVAYGPGDTISDKIRVEFSSTGSQLLDDKKSLDITTGQESKGVVKITDDANTPDGPEFSIAAGEDSGSYTEATGVEFTLKVVAGDVPVSHLQEAVTLTFSLTGPAGQSGVTVGGFPATYNAQTGMYTVTLPVGTAVDDMVVKVPVVEDSIIGTDTSIGIKLESVSGNESKLSGTAELAENHVKEGSSAEIYFTQGEQSIIEGGSIAFSMGLRNASGGTPMTAAQSITVTFSLGGVPGGMIDWDAANVSQYEWNGVSMCWDVTVVLPAGSSSLDIVFPTVDNSAFDGDRTVAISDVLINGGVPDAHITDATTGLKYTLSDPSDVVLQGNQSFDGSAYEHGLNITGGDGYNEITGSGHADVIRAGDGGSRIETGDGNDIVYAGKGDDVIDGGIGQGSDVFAWESADDFGGSDTILNFDFNCTWQGDTLQVDNDKAHDKIQINFKDLLGESESLTDLLQGIAPEGQGNTFSYKGDNGAFQASFLDDDTLQITLLGNDQSTLQTITVESCSSFHQDITNLSQQQAVAILEQILKDC